MMMNETPAVVAYPVDHSPTRHSNNTSIMDENVYSSSIGDSKFADDTIEMSGNFFSQLDSMIAAVKVESSALDSMKEKLREVENLRNQISNFTKRLLDADQANLNLKSNLVKVQEMYAESRKAKAEVESSIVPLRAELNRTKDQCNKERMGRLAAQQLVAQMKDQIAMLENANENLSREVKTIPALAESNEILKNDLSQLRKRYKEEKAQMQKHIKGLETQSRDVDTIKGCVRELSMKLLDLANAGVASSSSSIAGLGMGMNMGMGGAAAAGNPNSAAYIAQQSQMRMQPQQAQQQQQQMRYPQQAPSGSNVYYQQQAAAAQGYQTAQLHQQMMQADLDDGEYDDQEEEESGDYDDPDTGMNRAGDHDYDQDSFVAEVNSSIESVGSIALIGKPSGGGGGAGKSGGGGGGGSGGKKKKVVKRKSSGAQQAGAAGRGQQQQPQPRMMQQLDGGNSSSNNNNGMQQQQQVYQQPQQYRSAGGNPQQQQQQQGMSQSFSLPRI